MWTTHGDAVPVCTSFARVRPIYLKWSGRQLRSKATAEPPITLRNLERKSWKPVFLGKPEMWGGKVSGKRESTRTVPK